jgi:cell division protein FtsQ
VRAAAVIPAPLDVRLMNATATLLFVVVACMLFAASCWWAVRHPLFALTRITVEGDVAHNSAATLRANVAPRVAGNFFTVDLAQARRAFEDIPWVRRAVVRREFPNRLRVSLQEHHPVALWGAEGASTLVNSFGEVFEANIGDVELDGLPRLAGPQDQSAQILATYRRLAPLVERLDLTLDQLTLTGRGSWRAVLDSGARIEMGRGTPDEVMQRAERFVQTITQAASRYGRRPEALVAADLRHTDGYAIELRGVSTVSADAQKK